MKQFLWFSLILIMFSCNSGSETGEKQSVNDYSAVLISNNDQSQPTNFDGKTLAMTAGFENPYVLVEDESDVYLYISIEGTKIETDQPRTPLNISLVVDRSGSMQSNGKLSFVKKACEIVVDNLSQEDNLSLVAYDTYVNIIQSQKKVENKGLLKQKIRDIYTGGSTNLSGGMLEGYAQVKSLFKEKSVNRVLLLSDGLANHGVTDREELQKIVASKFENDKIALSTFGVGADFNEDMMTNLSEYGKGNYYFIDSPDEIPTIFRKELEGLLSVVAQNAKITIDFNSENFDVTQVYGYDYKVEGNQLEVTYNDVFSNEEKAVLIRFRKKQPLNTSQPFKVKLTYDDVINEYNRVNEELSLLLSVTQDQTLYQNSFNEIVTRNKVLFISNYQFEQAIKEVDKGNYEEAKKLLHENKGYLYSNRIYVQQDSILMKQESAAKNYAKEIENIQEKSEQERKVMQKESKGLNYIRKKKKKE